MSGKNDYMCICVSIKYNFYFSCQVKMTYQEDVPSLFWDLGTLLSNPVSLNATHAMWPPNPYLQ